MVSMPKRKDFSCEGLIILFQQVPFILSPCFVVLVDSNPFSFSPLYCLFLNVSLGQTIDDNGEASLKQLQHEFWYFGQSVFQKLRYLLLYRFPKLLDQIGIIDLFEVFGRLSRRIFSGIGLSGRQSWVILHQLRRSQLLFISISRSTISYSCGMRLFRNVPKVSHQLRKHACSQIIENNQYKLRIAIQNHCCLTFYCILMQRQLILDYIQIQIMQGFRVPFTSFRGASDEPGYFQMLRKYFFPNFQLLSFTSIIITLNIIVFLISRVLYQPSAFDVFLSWPTQMDKWLLDIQLIKHDRSYFYQTVTAIFMHASYLHLIGNIVISIFLMYEMEYCWKPSILLGIVAAFLAHCFCILVLEGRYLGFSGALCSYLGMCLAIVATHWRYLRELYGSSFVFIIIWLVLMSFLMIGFSKAAIVHLMGYVFGFLISLATFPKHPESSISQTIDIGLKVLVGIIVIIVVVLALVV